MTVKVLGWREDLDRGREIRIRYSDAIKLGSSVEVEYEDGHTEQAVAIATDGWSVYCEPVAQYEMARRIVRDADGGVWLAKDRPDLPKPTDPK